MSKPNPKQRFKPRQLEAPKFANHNPVIPYELKYRSAVTHKFFQHSSIALQNYVERLAALLKMSSSDKVLYQKLTNWCSGLITELADETKKLHTQVIDQMGDLPQQVVTSVPDSYHIKFSITHPFYWQILPMLEQLDECCATTDALFLLGRMDDIQSATANRQANFIFSLSVERIRGMTMSYLGRKGGTYSAKDFITALKERKVLSDDAYPGYDPIDGNFQPTGPKSQAESNTADTPPHAEASAEAKEKHDAGLTGEGDAQVAAEETASSS